MLDTVHVYIYVCSYIVICVFVYNIILYIHIIYIGTFCLALSAAETNVELNCVGCNYE